MQHSPNYTAPATGYNHVADMEAVVDSVAAPSSNYWERHNPNSETLDAFDIPAIADPKVPFHYAAHMGLGRHFKAPVVFESDSAVVYARKTSNTAYAFGDLENWD